MSQKEIEIRTTLRGKLAQQFLDIMNEIGTTHKTETIRVIITKAHRNLGELKT